MYATIILLLLEANLIYNWQGWEQNTTRTDSEEQSEPGISAS